MCWFYGIVWQSRDIRKWLKAISHRWPDSHDFYHGDKITLWFNRLSIIDLSANGNQPMSNRDWSVVIVCNWEIYNFQELRQQLIQKYEFKSKTDIEVLIYGYMEWWISGLLQRINGMYAFWLYDKVQQKLFLVRDRIGKKPLYYFNSGSYVAFASEVKAFFDLPEFKFDINEQMLDLFFWFPYLPSRDQTIIKWVSKVQPWSYIEIQIGGANSINNSDNIKNEVCKYKTNDLIQMTEKSYWNYQSLQDSKLYRYDWVDKFEELLIDSVTKRLIADVPVWVLLSWWLDSSLITVLASKYSDKQVKTINISFQNSQIDESGYARIVANHCGTDHMELKLKTDDIYQEFKDNMWIYDSLNTTDWWLFSTFMMSRLIEKHGIKVLLVWEWADEIFWWYSRYQLSLLPISLLPIRIKSILFHYAVMREPSLKYSWFMLHKMNEIKDEFFRKIQYFETFYSLPNHYCMKVDKWTSAASLEARAPYMDYRIVEQALTINRNDVFYYGYMNLRNTNEKKILREIGKKYLPKQIFTRKKRWWMLPINEMLEIWVQKDKEMILNNNYLTARYWRDYLEKLIISTPTINYLKYKREWILWKCLVFALWYDYFNKFELSE